MGQGVFGSYSGDSTTFEKLPTLQSGISVLPVWYQWTLMSYSGVALARQKGSEPIRATAAASKLKSIRQKTRKEKPRLVEDDSPIVDENTEPKHSMSLRMPASLFDRLKIAAREAHRSVNGQIIEIIENWLDGQAQMPLHTQYDIDVDDSESAYSQDEEDDGGDKET